MTKPTKITYLLESTTLWGGTKVALEQAEALSDAGCDVTILSKDAGPAWYPLRLPVIQVPDFNKSTIPASDIIVGTFWLTVKAAYGSEKGLLVHLCQGYEGGNKELLPLKGAIDEVYSYRIPKLTVSPHMDGFLKERFHSEAYFIGQMLDRQIFHPLQDRGPERGGIFRVLVVGPFEADVKNIPVALKGIVLAKKRLGVRVELIRASQFPLSKTEEEIIRPDVYHFHIPYPSMGRVYRDADLFISTSKEAEGFGLPAIEAMACGVPAILSEISSYRSFDEPRDYALFVDGSDAEAVARAIEEVFRNRPLRERLVQRGLEVAEKFTKERVVERLGAAFEQIMYRDRLSRTKTAWDSYDAGVARGEKRHWWDSPVIIGHCQRLVTGDSDIDIYQFLAREFVKSPLDRGLSICSGSGEFERGVLDNRICRSMDAYEISEERVREGRRVAQVGNYAITFHTEDVNRAVFRKDHYDVFFSWSALHHIENLEGVCENARDALRDGGLVVVQEFIGPNQFQWTDRQLEIINRVLMTLPERLRIHPGTGETVSNIARPTIEEMNRNDPSEAIRSREIISVLRRFFTIKTVRYFGGPIFNPLFGGIIANFDHGDERDVALIRMVLLMEETLIQEKILDHDYAVIIAEKKS